MLQTLFEYYKQIFFQGKGKNVYLVASVVIVAIQENILDSGQFCASFPAPIEVFSKVKYLVLPL